MSLLGRLLFETLPGRWAGVFRQRAPADSAPAVAMPQAVYLDRLCKLLKRRQEVDQCTQFLKAQGFVSHNDPCKDWDLAHIVRAIGDGNVLDMGSSDSYILKNLLLKGTQGAKYGIDLRPPLVAVPGAKYLVGDLMETGMPDAYFANITCLSVIEHQVDLDRFAAESARLLVSGGRLFVTFDYWEPKVVPPIKLFGLDWQPLDAAMLRAFIATCANHGLRLVADFDYAAGDPVIDGSYFSPHPDVSYTFGMAVFQKA